MRPNRPLSQIRDRGYADKYRDQGGPIHLIGMAFSRDRNLTTVEVAPA